MDERYNNSVEFDLICKNCNTIVLEKYCPSCGEIGNTRFDLNQVKEDILELWDWKKGFFYTMFMLLFRPIQLIRDYLNGKTKPYTGPIKMIFLIAAIDFFVLGVYYPKLLFNDLYISFFGIVPIVAWLFQNLLFFRKPKLKVYQHLIIIFFTCASIGSFSLLFDLIAYPILLGVYGINPTQVPVVAQLPLIFIIIYSLYIPFGFFEMKRVKKILLMIPYSILGFFWLILILIFVEKFYPERNLLQLGEEPKPLMFVNGCIEDVKVAIAYKGNDSQWKKVNWIEVKANDTTILHLGKDTLLIAVPTVFLYAYNPELDWKWSGEKKVIFDWEEYQAYEWDLTTKDNFFYHKIICNDEILKKEKDELKEFIGKRPLGIQYVGLDSLSNVKGIKLQYVYANLPADKAGLSPNDIITKIDTFQILTSNIFMEVLKYLEKDTINITYIRNGEESTTKLIPEVYLPDTTMSEAIN